MVICLHRGSYVKKKFSVNKSGGALLCHQGSTMWMTDNESYWQNRSRWRRHHVRVSEPRSFFFRSCPLQQTMLGIGSIAPGFLLLRVSICHIVDNVISISLELFQHDELPHWITLGDIIILYPGGGKTLIIFSLLLEFTFPMSVTWIKREKQN